MVANVKDFVCEGSILKVERAEFSQLDLFFPTLHGPRANNLQRQCVILSPNYSVVTFFYKPWGNNVDTWNCFRFVMVRVETNYILICQTSSKVKTHTYNKKKRLQSAEYTHCSWYLTVKDRVEEPKRGIWTEFCVRPLQCFSWRDSYCNSPAESLINLHEECFQSSEHHLPQLQRRISRRLSGPGAQQTSPKVRPHALVPRIWRQGEILLPWRPPAAWDKRHLSSRGWRPASLLRGKRGRPGFVSSGCSLEESSSQSEVRRQCAHTDGAQEWGARIWSKSNKRNDGYLYDL